jgi:hypothetical protein
MASAAFWLHTPPPTTRIGRWALVEHRLELGKLALARLGLGGLGRRRVGHGRQVDQHVLGQGQHDRARPARGRDLVGAVDVFGNARGVDDLADELGGEAEHLLVVDFLEALAVDRARAVDLADEQDHRRRILGRAMCRPGDALVAPGPRVTKQMPGLPVSLP